MNVGGGDDRRPDFLTVDLRSDVADIVAPADQLPVADGSVEEILATDILEHFPAQRTGAVLAEWLRVLEPGGKLTVRVPNLLRLSEWIVAGKRVEDAIRNIYGGHRWGPDGAWDTHHTGWTPRLFESLLVDSGFWFDEIDDALNMTAVCYKPLANTS